MGWGSVRIFGLSSLFDFFFLLLSFVLSFVVGLRLHLLLVLPVMLFCFW